jgi:hypothetical protein
MMSLFTINDKAFYYKPPAPCYVIRDGFPIINELDIEGELIPKNLEGSLAEGQRTFYV